MTWAEMRAEVKVVNTQLGWWDKPVRFKTAMALLHEEVSEALQAWRKWEFADMTGDCHHESASDLSHKPEGFGSELADCLIRLLDDDERFALNLGDWWHPGDLTRGRFAVWQDLPDNLDDLHNDISWASMMWDSSMCDVDVAHNRGLTPLADFLTRLVQIANLYGVDLEDEYRRKLEYNKTREYRHGKAV